MKQPGLRFVFIALFICIANSVYSQQNSISIRFIPQYDAVPVEIGKKYSYKNDSVEIEVLKFYISGIRFYQGNELVDEVEKKHHLIDIENPASQSISCTIGKNVKFNRMVFNIGVDSTTNEAGASGGDLDPTNGMYWEWRSGYINLKLEGRSRICPARKNQFAFHIGGYQYPYNTIQQLDLPVADSTTIAVVFDVKAFLNQVNIGELYEVMSPNERQQG
ncbi:MAG: hypothetical protein IPP72_20815 [Chitinophagaceae bacterium]|nr:hypothetical protein [Chitinophagaceae bacterium]